MKKLVLPGTGGCLVAGMILWLCCPAPVSAVGSQPLKSVPVTLAWEPADDPSVTGYGIYYGPTNQVALQHINAGTNLNVTLFDLEADRGYRFYAVSYDSLGNESVPSNELVIAPPVLSRLKIARQAAGNFSLTLRAAPGSVCQIEYAATPDSGGWQTLGLATADANGNVAVIDPTPPVLPSRFYRVARLLNPPPFTHIQLTKSSDGGVSLALNGSPGTTWMIEWTASLANPVWTPLTMVTANAIGDAFVSDPISTQIPSRFYRAAQVVNPPPFTRLQVARQSNGSMKLSLNGSPGTAWNIQFAASPNSATWTTLASVTANDTGEATVTDSPPAGVASRFYRAKLQ